MFGSLVPLGSLSPFGTLDATSRPPGTAGVVVEPAACRSVPIKAGDAGARTVDPAACRTAAINQATDA